MADFRFNENALPIRFQADVEMHAVHPGADVLFACE